MIPSRKEIIRYLTNKKSKIYEKCKSIYCTQRCEKKKRRESDWCSWKTKVHVHQQRRPFIHWIWVKHGSHRLEKHLLQWEFHSTTDGNLLKECRWKEDSRFHLWPHFINFRNRERRNQRRRHQRIYLNERLSQSQKTTFNVCPYFLKTPHIHLRASLKYRLTLFFCIFCYFQI